MFDKLKRLAAEQRKHEESLYSQVVSELAHGERREGLWAKAFADAEGDEAKSQGLYIKYRVQSLQDELELSATIEKETDLKRERATLDQKEQTLREERKTKQIRKSLIANGYKVATLENEHFRVRYPSGEVVLIESPAELKEFASKHAVF